MSRPRYKKDKRAVRDLAIQDLQLLLGAEPHLAEARRILVPSTREKRDAIGEMNRMARKRLLPRVIAPDIQVS